MSELICLSHQRWEDALTRTRRLLPTGAEVLFFEPVMPRFSFGGKRARRPRDGQLVADGVTAYTLPASITLEEDYAVSAPRQIKKNAAFILKAMRKHGFEAPLLWCTSPHYAMLPDALPHSGLLYDCGENWGLSLSPMWEEQLCEGADLVLAASPLLQQRLAGWNENLTLLPNGFDSAPYRLCENAPRRIPADLAKIPAPVFGAIGDIPERCSLGPILYAAKNHPDWHFVFAGYVSPYHPELPALKRLPNIHIIGTKSPISHPHYLRQFNVVLELLDAEPAADTLGAPFYGALSIGAPIVLLSEQDTAFYSDVVYAAHFDIDFVDACRRALEESSSLLRRTRQRYATAADWALRQEDCRRLLRSSTLL